MTNTYNPTGTQQQGNQAKIQPADLKNLLQKQGKATIGNQEYTLKDPQLNDPKLQAITNDPSFRIKEINYSKDQAELEISAKDKTLKIKIDVKTVQ